jgi:hypothetical protein
VRGVTIPAAPSRIKGTAALRRRLNGLYLAAVRFNVHRAKTPEDLRFAAVLCDHLAATLAALDGGVTGQRTPGEVRR